MKAATIIFSPNGGISLIESFALVCMFAHTNLITYESLYSSSYLLNEYLLYDKLWGPSQRVVTLFLLTPFLENPLNTSVECLASLPSM